MLNSPQYSIRFGETADRGVGPNKAFPFFFNFVPIGSDTWERDKGAGTAANLTGIGPQVAPGQTITHNVNLTNDYLFKMLWIKYTVYHIPQLALAGYRWYDIPAGWFQEQGDYQTMIGTPLHQFVSISLHYLPTTDYAYGGVTRAPWARLTPGAYPVPIDVIQGYDFGCGQIRFPHLLPKQGVLVFDITNNHDTKTLVVGGCIYGMKVRL